MRPYLSLFQSSGAPLSHGFTPLQSLPSPPAYSRQLRLNQEPCTRFIVLSQGNSGTTSTFAALCGAGVPSVHFMLECLRLNGKITDLSETAPLPITSRLKQPQRSAIASHEALVSLYRAAMAAAQRQPTRETASSWVLKSELALKHVVQGRHSLLDSPYPAYPSVLASAAFPPSLVSFVFIPRNSTQWAMSRLMKHGGSPVCHPHLWQQVADPLDLFLCVKECARLGSKALADCLVPTRNLSVKELAAASKANEGHVRKLFQGRLTTLPLFATHPGAARLNASQIAATLGCTMARGRVQHGLATFTPKL